MSTELLPQLNALINAEANQAEAELWRETRRLMQDAGYGPLITPAQIVSLVPNVHGINEILAATQETVPTPLAGSKMPRRKLTPEDERVIMARVSVGIHPEQIADDLGIARKVVITYLGRN